MGVRVGLFGLLGAGNIGNEASLEALLAYLRARHPDAVADVMCIGPGPVRARYGLDAVPMQWARQFSRPGIAGIVLRALGKPVDAVRTLAWVRRHDAVIVPGMGVLEASLPLGPWGMPYAMFLLSLSGRLTRTPVALVSVGANPISRPLTRWFFNRAAALARYRSYRDAGSREAMRERGVDVSADGVYPDVAFSLPAPEAQGSPEALAAQDAPAMPVVGVGVMAYYGGNDDRHRATELHAAYLDGIVRFIRWLADAGRTVHLYTGDACDDATVEEVLTALTGTVAPGQVSVRHATTFAELTAAMAPASLVVATRYHNVICALRLIKPVISLGYAAKNMEVMAGAGLGGYCQNLAELDVDLLIRQVTALENEWPTLRELVREQVAEQAARSRVQFDRLDAALFGPHTVTARTALSQ